MMAAPLVGFLLTRFLLGSLAIALSVPSEPDRRSTLLQRSDLRPGNPSESEGQRLHIISVTGFGTNLENFSIVAQDSWGARLGRTDNFTNICDQECGNVTYEGRRLNHILPLTAEDFTSNKTLTCIGPVAAAQHKFVWGFMTVYKQQASRGGPMPRWWFIKDDDTYVHIDRLMQTLDTYDSNDRVIVTNGFWRSTCGGITDPEFLHIAGGSGWAASAGMAAAMFEHAEDWLKFSEDRVQSDCRWYDQNFGWILKRVGNYTKVIDHNLEDIRQPINKCPEKPNMMSMQMKKAFVQITHDPKVVTMLAELCMDDPISANVFLRLIKTGNARASIPFDHYDLTYHYEDVEEGLVPNHQHSVFMRVPAGCQTNRSDVKGRRK